MEGANVEAGAAQPRDRARAAPPKPLPTGVVTFLFSDLVGSTEHLTRVGDAAYAAFLARHRRVMRAAFAANGGVEVDTQGDAFLAAFASADGAILAAVQAQRGSGPDEPKVRIGLHTGEPILTDEGYVGIDVHQGARVAAAAHGGQIVVSDRTAAAARARLPADLGLVDLGVHRLKDLREPQPIHQVLAPGLQERFPALRSLDAREHNLPVQLTSLVGREAELAAVRAMLDASRLVTLTGTGGTGKTRLALQLGAEVLDTFPDGVWFIDLAPLTDPSLVASELAGTLRVREEPGRAIAETVVAWATSRRLLVILDNCEHLLGACARLVHDLLSAAPGVRVLATSREPLGVPGEVVHRLPSLALPDRDAIERLGDADLLGFEAVQLFVERANAQRPGAVTGGAALRAAADACRRLDGIPLAIELAAARARTLGVEEISTRLNDRFRLLTAGTRSLLPRQQTLRALIDWSHDLLDDDERSLFARLAVFAGTFDLPIVERVCAGDGLAEGDVTDLLLRLADKSLVTAEAHGARTSFRMLDTLRAYAGERLAAMPDGGVRWRRRHTSALLALAERGIDDSMAPGDRTGWLSEVDAALDDLRLAVAFALQDQPETALRIVVDLVDLWLSRGRLAEGIELVDAALRAAPDPGPHLRARALTLRAQIEFNQSRYAETVEDATHAAGIALAADDRRSFRIAITIRGLAHWEQGETNAAEHDLVEALELARAANDRSAVGTSLNNLGILALSDRRPSDALRRYEEAAVTFREMGAEAELVRVLNNIAVAADQLGDLDRAVGAAREAAEITRRAGLRGFLGYVLLTLAHVELRLGDLAGARRDTAESLDVLEEQGVGRAIAYAVEYTALAEEAAGRPLSALRLLAGAAAMRENLGAALLGDEGVEIEHVTTRARAAVDAEAAESALAAGRRMTRDEAIAAARAALTATA